MTKRISLPALLVVMACVGAIGLTTAPAEAAQAERERIDVSARGPQVGDTIPDFTLNDQYGATWTRESILGRNGTMLVFLRSADW